MEDHPRRRGGSQFGRISHSQPHSTAVGQQMGSRMPDDFNAEKPEPLNSGQEDEDFLQYGFTTPGVDESNLLAPWNYSLGYNSQCNTQSTTTEPSLTLRHSSISSYRRPPPYPYVEDDLGQRSNPFDQEPVVQPPPSPYGGYSLLGNGHNRSTEPAFYNQGNRHVEAASLPHPHNANTNVVSQDLSSSIPLRNTSRPYGCGGIVSEAGTGLNCSQNAIDLRSSQQISNVEALQASHGAGYSAAQLRTADHRVGHPNLVATSNWVNSLWRPPWNTENNMYHPVSVNNDRCMIRGLINDTEIPRSGSHISLGVNGPWDPEESAHRRGLSHSQASASRPLAYGAEDRAVDTASYVQDPSQSASDFQVSGAEGPTHAMGVSANHIPAHDPLLADIGTHLSPTWKPSATDQRAFEHSAQPWKRRRNSYSPHEKMNCESSNDLEDTSFQGAHIVPKVPPEMSTPNGKRKRFCKSASPKMPSEKPKRIRRKLTTEEKVAVNMKRKAGVCADCHEKHRRVCFQSERLLLVLFSLSWP